MLFNVFMLVSQLSNLNHFINLKNRKAAEPKYKNFIKLWEKWLFITIMTNSEIQFAFTLTHLKWILSFVVPLFPSTE